LPPRNPVAVHLDPAAYSFLWVKGNPLFGFPGDWRTTYSPLEMNGTPPGFARHARIRSEGSRFPPARDLN
jgi:hypothetical protein